ncbi:MAG: carbon monoxide dehydrogenase subunit [Actinomycetia bacterium]|nr:carbon monoxide dehydrogenase subunit [Actinomycetes bacterium]
MEINDSFRVSTPIDATWKVMLDIEGIAPCLPGAQLQEVEGDEYRGIVKVKVGPITAQYKGTARLAEVDEANRRIVIDASGRDTRGQGNAKASIVVTMTAEGGGTKVDVSTDLSITGKVAQFGRGVLADVSSKLMGQFVENVERDVLGSAGGGDTTHAGGAYEQALESAPSVIASSHGSTAATPSSVTSSGSASSSDAGSANGSETGGAAAASGPRRIDSPEVEPVDLFGVAGAPVTKRLVPIGIGALVLFILWRVLRNR